MKTQLFTQPDYAPGLHNASADELLRMADAEPAPSPLLRALVEALADRVDMESVLEEREAEWEKERDQWEKDEAAYRERLEASDDANDALWGALKTVMDYAERDVGELESLACDEDSEAEARVAREDLDDAYAALQDHPGPTERARREAEAARREAAERAQAEAILAVADLWGKPARLSYMVPRGRKWHEGHASYRLQVADALRFIAAHPHDKLRADPA